VADVGPSRQQRQQAFVPDQPRDLLSSEAHQAVDPVPGMQRKYAQNAVYNGSDALARLRGEHGG
jgi:hypothetical protein